MSITGFLVLGPVRHLLCRGRKGPARPGVCFCLLCNEESRSKDMGGPSRQGERSLNIKGRKAHNKIKEREESVLMSQIDGRWVSHMVPRVLPPGAGGNCQSQPQKRLRRTLKADELTLCCKVNVFHRQLSRGPCKAGGSWP